MQKKFQEIYEDSIKNPEKFWQEASEDIFWFKKPNKILNKSAQSIIEDSDIILFVLQRLSLDKEDELIIEKIKEKEKKLVSEQAPPKKVKKIKSLLDF